MIRANIRDVYSLYAYSAVLIILIIDMNSCCLPDGCDVALIVSCICLGLCVGNIYASGSRLIQQNYDLAAKFYKIASDEGNMGASGKLAHTSAQARRLDKLSQKNTHTFL
jgi:hypothetical protein